MDATPPRDRAGREGALHTPSSSRSLHAHFAAASPRSPEVGDAAVQRLRDLGSSLRSRLGECSAPECSPYSRSTRACGSIGVACIHVTCLFRVYHRVASQWLAQAWHLLVCRCDLALTTPSLPPPFLSTAELGAHASMLSETQHAAHEAVARERAAARMHAAAFDAQTAAEAAAAVPNRSAPLPGRWRGSPEAAAATSHHVFEETAPVHDPAAFYAAVSSAAGERIAASEAAAAVDIRRALPGLGAEGSAVPPGKGLQVVIDLVAQLTQRVAGLERELSLARARADAAESIAEERMTALMGVTTIHTNVLDKMQQDAQAASRRLGEVEGRVASVAAASDSGLQHCASERGTLLGRLDSLGDACSSNTSAASELKDEVQRTRAAAQAAARRHAEIAQRVEALERAVRYGSKASSPLPMSPSTADGAGVPAAAQAAQDTATVLSDLARLSHGSSGGGAAHEPEAEPDITARLTTSVMEGLSASHVAGRTPVGSPWRRAEGGSNGGSTDPDELRDVLSQLHDLTS